MKLCLLLVTCGLAAAAYLPKDDSLFYVDELLQNENVSPNRFLERVKTRLGEVLDGVQKMAAKKPEVLEEFKEKIQEARDKIEAMADGTISEIRKSIKDINKHISDLRQQIKERFAKGKSYSAENSNRIDQLFTRIKKFFATKEGIDTVRNYIKNMEVRHTITFLAKSYIDMVPDELLMTVLQEILRGIPDTPIDESEDIHAIFHEVHQYLKTDAGLQEIKLYFEHLETENELIVRLKTVVGSQPDSVIREVLDALLPEFYYANSANYNNRVDQVFTRIKKFFSTKEGIDMVRNYVKNMEVRHSVTFLVKSFIEMATDEALISLLHEVLKAIPETPIDESEDIHAIFHEAHQYLKTDTGLQEIKEYFEHLDTDDQIISRLKTLITSQPDDVLREVLDALLPEFYYAVHNYDSREKLLSLFKRIRDILQTAEGIRHVRDYARAVEITHPALFLIKAFIESSSDDVLRAILTEIFQGMNYEAQVSNADAADLESLFLQVRDILKTDEGYHTLKNYLMRIQSDHPIVSRLHGFITQATDETLKEILDALFGGI